MAQKDEHEPVAEITADDMGRPFNAIRIGAHFYKEIPPVGTKLYTAPPKRKPLTDEEVQDKWEHITGHSIFGGDLSEGRAMYISPNEVMEFASAIEKAHGIRVEHEPR